MGFAKTLPLEAAQLAMSPAVSAIHKGSTAFSASRATEAFSINDTGVITGFYSDSSGTHGFIRTP